MKNLILTILILVLIGECIYLVFPKKQTPKVLAEKTFIATPIPTQIPTGAPEPTPTLMPTPTPLKTPKASPQPKFTSQQINGFIDRFAGQYGVDPNILRHIAICESGFNPDAYNAGYAGLYQFGGVTWKNIRLKIGEDPNTELRYNAEEAVQTAAYSLGRGNGRIWPNCQP